MQATTPKKDVLTDFLYWFLQKGLSNPQIPLFGAVNRIEDVTSILLYRKNQFQVQLFAVPGNCVIPEHTHPNVDSYEVYVGGHIKFSHSGKWTARDEDINLPTPNGLPTMRGQIVRVRPSDKHGGVFGPGGGVFLSVQHWLNGISPHCVAADYSGPVMGANHFAQVKYGEPTLLQALHASHAASLEEIAPTSV